MHSDAVASESCHIVRNSA